MPLLKCRSSFSGLLRLLPIVLVVAGCGDGQHDADSAPVHIDTLPDGIVHVVNDGPSGWPDTSGWRLVEEEPIAPVAGSPGELSTIIGIAASRDGVVAVMDVEPMVKLFDAAGAFLGAIGRAGAGPGEYRLGLIGIHHDTVVVQDPSNSRMVLFLTDGTPIGEHPTRCCHYSRTLDIDDEGIASIPGAASGGKGSALYRTTLAGEVIGAIDLPEVSRGPTWRHPAGDFEVTLPVPLHGERMSRMRPDGMLIHGTTDRYRFILSRTGNDTVRIIDALPRRVAISAAEKDSIMNAALRWAEDTAAMRAVAKAGDIPGHWTPWTGMAVDGEGRLWVGVPGEGNPLALLQVFDSEGRLLGDVPVPHPDILKGTWTDDRVYVRSESEEGFPMIRVFRVADR